MVTQTDYERLKQIIESFANAGSIRSTVLEQRGKQYHYDTFKIGDILVTIIYREYAPSKEKYAITINVTKDVSGKMDFSSTHFVTYLELMKRFLYYSYVRKYGIQNFSLLDIKELVRHEHLHKEKEIEKMVKEPKVEPSIEKNISMRSSLNEKLCKITNTYKHGKYNISLNVHSRSKTFEEALELNTYIANLFHSSKKLITLIKIPEKFMLWGNNKYKNTYRFEINHLAQEDFYLFDAFHQDERLSEVCKMALTVKEFDPFSISTKKSKSFTLDL